MADQTGNNKELMLQFWFQANTEIMFWNQKTNETLSEIRKQLLGIAFILIPLSGSIIFTDINISDTLKFVLILGLIFIFASIVLGFIQMYIDANFFSGYMKDNIILSNVLKSNFTDKPLTIKKVLDLYEKKKQEKNISPRSNPNQYCGVFQIVSISIGVILLLYVVHGLLYSNQNTKYYGTIQLHGKSYQIQIQKTY